MTESDEPPSPEQQAPTLDEAIESVEDDEANPEQPSNDQFSSEVTSLKSEIELLKQRINKLEQENQQLFKREGALKEKYIQLLEKHQK